MKKGWDDDELNKEFEPSKADYDALRAGIAKYKLLRINGRLQDPFLQYMKELDLIYFGKFGDYVVKDPAGFTKYNRMHASIQAVDQAEEERMFRQYPEMREEAQERARGHIKRIREEVFGLGKAMRV